MVTVICSVCRQPARPAWDPKHQPSAEAREWLGIAAEGGPVCGECLETFDLAGQSVDEAQRLRAEPN